MLQPENQIMQCTYCPIFEEVKQSGNEIWLVNRF